MFLHFKMRENCLWRACERYVHRADIGWNFRQFCKQCAEELVFDCNRIGTVV